MAVSLFTALAPGDRIRLLGVRAEGLVDGAALVRQPAFGERERGWSHVERAADAAAARFGNAAVRPASLLGADAVGHMAKPGDGERVDWWQMPGPWNAADRDAPPPEDR